MQFRASRLGRHGQLFEPCHTAYTASSSCMQYKSHQAGQAVCRVPRQGSKRVLARLGCQMPFCRKRCCCDQATAVLPPAIQRGFRLCDVLTTVRSARKRSAQRAMCPRERPIALGPLPAVAQAGSLSAALRPALPAATWPSSRRRTPSSA